MGRKRRNITPDQKRAANREKSKRHYERERDSINERRRKQYRVSRSIAQSSDTPDTTHKNGEKSKVAEWMEEATRVLTAIEEITDNVPKRYIERLYQTYVADKNSKPLQEQVSALGKLRTSILRCESKVLNREGVGVEYHKVRSVSEDVANLIKWVDEIYVYSVVDSEELKRAYQNKELSYQCSGQ